MCTQTFSLAVAPAAMSDQPGFQTDVLIHTDWSNFNLVLVLCFPSTSQPPPVSLILTLLFSSHRRANLYAPSAPLHRKPRGQVVCGGKDQQRAGDSQ